MVFYILSGLERSNGRTHINEFLVTDCCAFTVFTEHDAANVEVDFQSSWGTIIIQQKVVDNQSQWFFPKRFYSHHKNGAFPVTETALLIRILYELEYIHHKSLHDTNAHITLTYVQLEVEKCSELQRMFR